MSNSHGESLGVGWPNRLMGTVVDLTGASRAPVACGPDRICRLELETRLDAVAGAMLEDHLKNDCRIEATELLANYRKYQKLDPQLSMVSAAFASGKQDAPPVEVKPLPQIRAEVSTDYGPEPLATFSLRFILEFAAGKAFFAVDTDVIAQIRKWSQGGSISGKEKAIIDAFLSPIVDIDPEPADAS